MSVEETISKLCRLSHLEIQDSEIPNTSSKIKDVLILFDKLDQFELPENFESEISTQFDKELEDLRDDEYDNNLGTVNDNENKFQFLNTKKDFVVGPRI